ncbi:MAG: DUF72 domain-containing protein [Candidatus Latescibacterota bacterium]|nr:MAG: DUF72 domain-containing protein [Candidatus Latescibacterota bacterium]
MKIRVPRSLERNVRIGTCSWKYDSWKGLYYDKGKNYRADDYLPAYARFLDSVEVDQWFWSLFPGGLKLPETRTVKTYAASVPDDFVFTVKAPNSLTLTHYYSRQPKRHAEYAGKPNEHFLDVELLERFLDRLAPLEKKLGPIMFQFEYLNRKKMPSKEMFFDRVGEFIAAAPRGFEYAIESRNPNYYSPAFFDFLGKHNIGFVYIEGYYMPPIGEVFEEYQPATADHCVIRLHGGDRLEMEQATGEVWNRVVEPKPEGLAAAARITRFNSQRGIRTFVNVNNHYEGSAPVTIERFLQVLEEKV